MASFLFAMAIIVWFATAALSRKRLNAIKEKDGIFGVILAYSFLLFLISLVLLIAIIIYNNNVNYVFELMDIAAIFFYVVTGICAVEIIIASCFAKQILDRIKKTKSSGSQEKKDNL